MIRCQSTRATNTTINFCDLLSRLKLLASGEVHYCFCVKMGGAPIPKIPDYKIYSVQHAPELVEVERKLAQLGLKDPWLRNEVWRYTMDGSKGLSVFRRMTKSLFRGFPIAVGVTAVLVCGEKVYSRIYPSAHHGDHH